MNATQTNKKREQARIAQNYVTTVTGTLVIEQDGSLTIIKLVDAKLWDVTSQKYIALSNDPDKFQIIEEDRGTATTEFWFRFKKYLKTRFNRFVNIELTYAN